MLGRPEQTDLGWGRVGRTVLGGVDFGDWLEGQYLVGRFSGLGRKDGSWCGGFGVVVLVYILNLRTTTRQKCAAVLRRARI